MKSARKRMKLSRNASLLLCVAAAGLAGILRANGAAMGKSFPSPDDAVRALANAVNNRDTNELAAIFGPDVENIKSPDPVQARNELATFTERFNASNHIEHADDGRCILEI